jgi:Protein of unknown function (DUF998)
MDQRGAEETLRGSMHPPLTAVMSLLIVAAMISAAAVQGRRFRLYSIWTILTLVVFGALAARYAPQLEAGEPTPWLGVLERINIYAYLLWVAVLAISLASILLGGEQVVFERPAHQLCAGAESEAALDAGSVRLDRTDAEHEPLGDLAVGVA